MTKEAYEAGQMTSEAQGRRAQRGTIRERRAYQVEVTSGHRDSFTGECLSTADASKHPQAIEDQVGSA